MFPCSLYLFEWPPTVADNIWHILRNVFFAPFFEDWYKIFLDRDFSPWCIIVFPSTMYTQHFAIQIYIFPCQTQ